MGSINLLAEMKKIKGSKKAANNLPDTVAGKTGEEAIVREFRKVCQDLNNMSDDTINSS